jgi:hypothetical protein
LLLLLNTGAFRNSSRTGQQFQRRKGGTGSVGASLFREQHHFRGIVNEYHNLQTYGKAQSSTETGDSRAPHTAIFWAFFSGKFTGIWIEK